MGLLELGADEIADLLAVYRLACHTHHHGFHHRADLFEGSRAGFLNDCVYDSGELSGREGLRKIGFKNGYFLPFLCSEFCSITFFELFNRFPALLDHGGHDAAHFGIVEILLDLHFLVHDGSLDHANHIHPQLVTGLHGQL